MNVIVVPLSVVCLLLFLFFCNCSASVSPAVSILRYFTCPTLYVAVSRPCFMHQSIPAVPSAPPPRLLQGICPPCQSRGWGICKFCAARRPGICQPQGYSGAFDTYAVSYQNITMQRILLEKSRLAHLSRIGGCKDCSRFYACISSLLIKPEFHSETWELLM